MLSECELQDKGKGLYTEISTLLSEYLVIQEQENLQIVLHALTVLSGNVVLSALITNLYTCTSGLTERDDLLVK